MDQDAVAKQIKRLRLLYTGMCLSFGVDPDNPVQDEMKRLSELLGIDWEDWDEGGIS